jgi:hypothetical protein
MRPAAPKPSAKKVAARKPKPPAARKPKPQHTPPAPTVNVLHVRTPRSLPMERYLAYKILSAACACMGVRVRVHEKRAPGMLMVFEDATIKQCELGGCLNGRVGSIAKQKVAELHRKHFGRSIDVDPAAHVGQLLKKTDDNSTGQYAVVSCPTPALSGFVYQKILGGMAAEKTEYKLYYLLGAMVLQAIRLKFPPGCVDGHKATNLGGSVVPIDTIFRTEEERTHLLAFMKDFGVDWARADIMLDDDGAPYILDVNDTATVMPYVPEAVIRELAPVMRRHLEASLPHKAAGR